MKKSLIDQHWEISSEQSGKFSNLGRLVILGLFVFGAPNKYILLYFTLDVLQYFAASLSYQFYARMQELEYFNKRLRYPYVNYPGYLFYYSKCIVLFYIIYVVYRGFV